jgi:hypothetical protein
VTARDGVGRAAADDLAAAFERFVVLPPHAAQALALFVAHTHTIAAAAEFTPYVHVWSATKRAGQDDALTVLGALACAPMQATSISEAALYRLISEGPLTLLLDEVDAVFGPKVGGDHEGFAASSTLAITVEPSSRGASATGRTMRVEQFPHLLPEGVRGDRRVAPRHGPRPQHRHQLERKRPG